MHARTRGRLRRGLALLGVCAVIAGMAVAQQSNAPVAQAQVRDVLLDLPTWDDVEKAKQNQASADKKVKEIEQLVAQGAIELDRLRNLHQVTFAELKEAEDALAAAAEKAQTLLAEAEASRKEADEAADRAGVIVAQMYRSGGVDRSMELFLDSDGSTADALLERLASMTKATERNAKLSQTAEQAANTADSLGQQAKAAEAEREDLRAAKKDKEVAAATAAANQGELVVAQEEQQRDLEVKLEALKDTTTKTVAGAQERERVEAERRKAEEERLRKIAEEQERQRKIAEEAERVRLAELEAERQRLEEEAIKNGTPPPPPVAPPVATPPPNSSNGWTYPTSGYYVSEGFRSPGRWDHTGIDLATACWTPIVAAASGTVGLTYHEWGAGGNMVTVNHENGWQTRYAHMVQWASVNPGQWVNAGQLLGYVGSTGASTGCHLHFEMRPNQDNGWYGFVNPADYIAF